MSDIAVFNPDDWKDVFVLVFLGVCSVATAGIPVWAKLKKIDTQVSNTHDENMRDEITRGFREIREDIKGLREELRTERIERIEGDRRKEAA
ncbi:minor tail protein [Mycobacterium phage EagleEye]|uniref:Minor tail protein n=1 Tax=Mycobacterium phage EagleEye TaxID=1429759 RepID=W0LMZ5_9CAUD|nr:minor tail protein [Mycobacterium phage EagleEye]AHG23812.1 minor tail protein [Mycobacterium phage EagleEye]QNJ55824.1 membrane protein [Mycobacterium phage PainterBoy]